MFVDDPGNQPPKIADTVCILRGRRQRHIDYQLQWQHGERIAARPPARSRRFNLAYSGSSGITFRDDGQRFPPSPPVPRRMRSSAIRRDAMCTWTDQLKNQLLAYTVSSTGALTPISGDFTTGNNPERRDHRPPAILTSTWPITPTNSVSGYSIGANGAPQPLPFGYLRYQGQGPSAIYIEPNARHVSVHCQISLTVRSPV